MNWERAISVLYEIYNQLDDDMELIERGHKNGDLNALQEKRNAINEAIGSLIREGNPSHTGVRHWSDPLD